MGTKHKPRNDAKLQRTLDKEAGHMKDTINQVNEELREASTAASVYFNRMEAEKRTAEMYKRLFKNARRYAKYYAVVAVLELIIIIILTVKLF
jgi:hypothetical protein